MTFGWAGGYAEVGNMAKTPTVKCMATGVQGPRDQFYKAPNNRYFQSEAVYQAWLAGRRKEKAKKNKPKPQKKPGRTTDLPGRML